MLVGLLMVVAGAGPAEDDWDLALLRQRVKRHIAKIVKRRATSIRSTPYSSRKTTQGSAFAARRAGTSAATAAVARTNAPTAANMGGSHGLTPAGSTSIRVVWRPPPMPSR